MRITLSKATAILRGYTTAEVLRICEALQETKAIRNVEITLNTENAYESIQAAVNQFGARLTIGAGTVLTKEQAIKAHQCGAAFFLSPGVMAKEIIDFCKSHHILTVSGALSATEVLQATANGADIIKIFPAASVGKTYFKDIKAPLGSIPLMAVGGINQKNASYYLANGADYLGVGSIFSQIDVLASDRSTLISQAMAFEKAMDRGEETHG